MAVGRRADGVVFSGRHAHHRQQARVVDADAAPQQLVRAHELRQCAVLQPQPADAFVKKRKRPHRVPPSQAARRASPSG
eukprot:6311315-Prymnesium_polylepis.1